MSVFPFTPHYNNLTRVFRIIEYAYKILRNPLMKGNGQIHIPYDSLGIN